MVNIKASYTVTPSQPTPSGKFPLSHCDQIKLPSHGPLLFVYRSNLRNNPSLNSEIETLKLSLSKALVHYYPLSGRLSRIEGGRWGVNCNAKGAHLLEAIAELNLDDLGDFVPTQIVERLMPSIDYACPMEEIPLLAVQLTRFRCGGLTLGVAACRAMVDGDAVVSFMNSWAKLARGVCLNSRELPFLDRTLLNSRKLNTGFRFDHSEFHPPPIWVGNLKNTKNEPTSAILKIKKEQVEKLKNKVYEFGNKNIPNAVERPYTSYEVIAGHLWRCVCKVRYEGNGDQQTRLSTLVNCRNRLNPPIPSNYFGNVTFPTATPTCSFKELMEKPLIYAVKNVREAIARIMDEYAISALDYLANQKDMDLLRNTFHSSAVSEDGRFRGNPNLYLVSWMNFPFNNTDFGWGNPVYLGPGQIGSDGKAFIMNDCDGDGFTVAICLQPSHLNALKKLFYEEMEELFPTSKL